MEEIAKLNNCPYPARKMRLLADLIRGMKADEALNVIKYHPKKAYAQKLEKLLLSAIKNWEDKNKDVDIDDLYIKRISVDNARMLKRIRPAPQGRAHRIRKRTNHVTVVLDSISQNAVKEVNTEMKKEIKSTEE
jgi:large subunit ribosomal protein L22